MRSSKSFSFPSLTLCLTCLCLLFAASSTASFDEELDESSLFNIGSSLACEIARCLKGQCVNSSSFPFYQCECSAGWMSPFGRSWLPCILPNCSIDLTCGNTTSAAPAPLPTVPVLGGTFDICSLSVCGNGVCVRNSSGSNSSDDYECQCDTGYVNLRNQSDGYCIRQCSLGADCANLGLPLVGGTSPPPPPPSLSSPASSSTSTVNHGQMNALQNRLFIVATLVFAVMWA